MGDALHILYEPNVTEVKDPSWLDHHDPRSTKWHKKFPDPLMPQADRTEIDRIRKAYNGDLLYLASNRVECHMPRSFWYDENCPPVPLISEVQVDLAYGRADPTSTSSYFQTVDGRELDPTITLEDYRTVMNERKLMKQLVFRPVASVPSFLYLHSIRGPEVLKGEKEHFQDLYVFVYDRERKSVLVYLRMDKFHELMAKNEPIWGLGNFVYGIRGQILDARPLHYKLMDKSNYAGYGPHPGFTLTLRDHQRQALDWLVQLECDPSKQCIPKTFPKNYPRLSETTPYFILEKRQFVPVHPKFLLSQARQYFDCPGAILADAKGTGKTVTCLALIHSNPLPDIDCMEWPDKRQKQMFLPSRATLIVVPSKMVARWEKEARRCIPSIKLAVCTDLPQWSELRWEDVQQLDVMITTKEFLNGSYRDRIAEAVGHVMLKPEELQAHKEKRERNIQAQKDEKLFVGYSCFVGGYRKERIKPLINPIGATTYLPYANLDDIAYTRKKLDDYGAKVVQGERDNQVVIFERIYWHRIVSSIEVHFIDS
jgi:hypothetical protein